MCSSVVVPDVDRILWLQGQLWATGRVCFLIAESSIDAL